MTSRTRQRDSRRAQRDPAIWRGSLAAYDAERAPLHQVNDRRAAVSWRLLSALIVVSLVIVLLVFFSSDAFYVHSIAIGGLRYMTSEEVFALSNIANLHIFWVDPAAVRADLLRSPTIANATVQVTWGTPMVQILIEEREPALVWEQAGIATWVDLQGRIMRQRENRPDLVRVTVDDPMAGVPEHRVNVDIVNGALQLHMLLPDLPALRYHAEYGLGYNDRRGWEAWLGTGTNMPEKLLVYNALVEQLQRENFIPSAVFVLDVDAPYYCCRSNIRSR